MTPLLPIGFFKSEQMDSVPFLPTTYTKEQAQQDNYTFDQVVKQYLRHWVEQGTLVGVDRSQASESDTEEFIQQGALRHFFKHYDDALERLLKHDDIASHLLRSSTQVFFEPDAYEPCLSQFEKRIYNLTAHREHLEVPFRYSPPSRQGDHGDSIGLTDMPPGEAKEDIGFYFGTRRSDTTALNLLAHQLRCESLFSSLLPIHIVTEGYMEDSLRAIRKATEAFSQESDQLLHCFVVQRRHAVDDRHLGAALLLMNSQHPDLPQRIIFCDTLKPNAQPPWWNTFKRHVDRAFPQPAGQPLASDRLEDGSVNLQRLHDGVPVRHQDIDCAFYTVSMAKALIQIARQSPELIRSGSIEELVHQMTERMPDYFDRANVAKAPELVRQVNIIRRWQTGQEALANIQRTCLSELIRSPKLLHDIEDFRWEPTEQATANLDISAAA